MSSLTRKKGSQLRHSTLLSASAGSRRRAKPVLSADYIVGLVDGEGCFYVNIAKSKRYRAGARVGLSLYIKMQANDRELLEKVKHRLGCGAVYFQKEQRPNHVQCYRYTVGAQRDILEKIIPFFLQYPLQSPSKRKSFEKFCKITDIVRKQGHLTKKGIEQIQKLKKRLNQRNTGLA